MVLVSACAIGLSVARLDPDPRHDGIMHVPAVAVATGLRLYTGVFDTYGPVTTWLQAALVKLAGPELIWQRLLAVAFVAFVATLTLHVSRLLGISTAMAGLAALFWLFAGPYISVGWPLFMWPSLVFAALVLASFAALAHGTGVGNASRPSRRQTYWLSLAGTSLSALAVWVRPFAGLLALAFVLLWLMVILVRRDSRACARRSLVSGAVLGCLLGLSLPALALVMTGSLQEALHQTLFATGGAYASASGDRLVLFVDVLAFRGLPAVGWVTALAATVALLRRRQFGSAALASGDTADRSGRLRQTALVGIGILTLAAPCAIYLPSDWTGPLVPPIAACWLAAAGAFGLVALARRASEAALAHLQAATGWALLRVVPSVFALLVLGFVILSMTLSYANEFALRVKDPIVGSYNPYSLDFNVTPVPFLLLAALPLAAMALAPQVLWDWIGPAPSSVSATTLLRSEPHATDEGSAALDRSARALLLALGLAALLETIQSADPAHLWWAASPFLVISVRLLHQRRGRPWVAWVLALSIVAGAAGLWTNLSVLRTEVSDSSVVAGMLVRESEHPGWRSVSGSLAEFRAKTGVADYECTEGLFAVYFGRYLPDSRAYLPWMRALEASGLARPSSTKSAVLDCPFYYTPLDASLRSSLPLRWNYGGYNWPVISVRGPIQGSTSTAQNG